MQGIAPYAASSFNAILVNCLQVERQPKDIGLPGFSEAEVVEFYSQVGGQIFHSRWS